MTQEAKPRITITHERYEELLAAEGHSAQCKGIALRSLETIGALMIRLGRSQRAGRRLALIHKRNIGLAKHAADCHKHNWKIDRARADEAEDRGESLQGRLAEATQLILQGVKVVDELEGKLTAALKRARESEAKLKESSSTEGDAVLAWVVELKEDSARATRLLTAKTEEVIIQRVRADKAEAERDEWRALVERDTSADDANYKLLESLHEAEKKLCSVAEAELSATKEALSEARTWGYVSGLRAELTATKEALEEVRGQANAATEMWKSAERDAFRPCEKTPKDRACCVSQPFRDRWCGACCDAWDSLHEASSPEGETECEYMRDEEDTQSCARAEGRRDRSNWCAGCLASEPKPSSPEGETPNLRDESLLVRSFAADNDGPEGETE